MVMDDGVTTRLGDDHYLMNTTTGGAARVYNWLDEWLQCEWRDFEVYMTSVTTQWAGATLVGPKAREVLARIGTDIDLSPEAFPHMSCREGRVAGVPARVFRVSFTGELRSGSD
jgi:sarcosine oxidase subunit alpha